MRCGPPALKVIASRGVGYDTIDVAAAKKRGIQVSNTPGVLTDCVADLAFGGLIAAARGLASGAVLDVFEDEPRVSPELLAMDHVLLLPHISSSTRETFTAMEDLVLDNLRSFFHDGSLKTPVAA